MSATSSSRWGTYDTKRALRCRAAVPAKGLLLGLLAALVVPAAAPAQSRFIEQARPMPSARAFHGSAVLGDYLYVFGGSTSASGQREDEQVDTSVFKAKINPSGNLDGWEQTTSLPGPRYYIANSTLVLNDVVYIIGGSKAPLGGERINTAIWTKPLPDGTLLPWQESPPFGEGLSTITAVSTPGHLHMIGGLKFNDQPTNEVWSNPLMQDGSMSGWIAGPPLPLPLWFHHAGVVGGRVYVWGGIPHPDTDAPIQPTNLVFSSAIQGSGRLGVWRQERTLLPVPFSQAPSAVAGSYMFSFCPPYPPSGTLSSDVWWTSVVPAGMSRWQRVESGIPNRVYHAVAPDYRHGSIYVTGGRSTRGAGMIPATYFFRLSPQARDQAERTWLAAQRAHGNSVSAYTTRSGSAAEPTILSYAAESRLPADAIAGFLPYSDARRIAQAESRPLVLYFNLRLVTPCQEQQKVLGEASNLQEILGKAAVAWIDSSEQPQLAQQMGVYRVPTWVFFDARGEARGRYIGVMSAEDLDRAISQLN